MIFKTRLDEIAKGMTIDREKKKSKYYALENARDWRGRGGRGIGKETEAGARKVRMRTR